MECKEFENSLRLVCKLLILMKSAIRMPAWQDSSAYCADVMLRAKGRDLSLASWPSIAALVFLQDVSSTDVRSGRGLSAVSRYFFGYMHFREGDIFRSRRGPSQSYKARMAPG